MMQPSAAILEASAARIVQLRARSGAVQVHYFEGAILVGTRTASCGTVAMGEASYSCLWPATAYFCAQCGELWGREVPVFEFDYIPAYPELLGNWVVEKRRCVSCGDGQFLVGKDLDGVSPELLTRELLALIEGELG